MKDVPGLTSHSLDGRPYSRRPDTEEQIRRALGSFPAAWDELARAGPPTLLSSEALVFLIRSIRDSDRDVTGKLIETLNLRILKTARRWCRGFDPMTTEHILDTVQTEILCRLLALHATRASEFLEVAFDRVVKTRTLNQVAKYRNRVVELSASGSGDLRDSDSGEERGEERIADPGPGPDAIISALRDAKRREALIRKARAAVKDPRYFEAVLLRYAHDWPLTASDPSKPSLERLFGMTSRQIQSWINKGIQQMRESIGEDHD